MAVADPPAARVKGRDLCPVLPTHGKYSIQPPRREILARLANMGKKHDKGRSPGQRLDDAVGDVKEFNADVKSKVDNMAQHGRDAVHSMEDKARNMSQDVRDAAGKAKGKAS